MRPSHRIIVAITLAAFTTATQPTPASSLWLNPTGNDSWSDPINWAPFGEPTLASSLAVLPDPLPFNGGDLLLSPAEQASELLIQTGGYTLDGGTLQINNGKITVNQPAGSNPTIKSQIVGTAGLEKLGTGVLNLQGPNTYTGSTTITSGILDISLASDRIPNLSTVDIKPGTQLRFFTDVDTETIGALDGAGDIIFGNANTGGINLIVGDNNADSSFSGTISDNFGGTGQLTKIGTGTLTLAGTQSQSQNTHINGGKIRVHGVGSTLNTSNHGIVVGSSSDGTFEVTGGAQANHNDVSIGADPGIQGTVNVDGLDSTWTVDNDGFNIGNKGNGTLNVTRNGTAEAFGHVILGLHTTSLGRLNVTDLLSNMSIAKSFNVGGLGQGTVLINQGGRIDVNAETNIASSTGSIGQATISGTDFLGLNNSTLNTHSLAIGGASFGTSANNGGTGSLIIAADGVVNVTQNPTFVLPSGTLALTDGGALNTAGLDVTPSGATFTHSGGTLTINDNEFLTPNTSYTISGTDSPQVIITQDASWTKSLGSINIGVDALEQGHLTISQGGTMTVDSPTSVGNNTTAIGTISVTGENSLYKPNSILFLGIKGTGSLSVADKATVNAADSISMAFNSDGEGFLNVTGDMSQLSADQLNVSLQGFAEATVSAGASLHIQNETSLAVSNIGAIGNLTITGTGPSAPSTFTTKSLYLGGDRISGASGGIASFFVHDQAVATVTTPNAKLWPDATIDIDNATLNVQALELQPGSKINLKNNGTINIPTTNTVTGSTNFNWSSGTLNVTGPSGAALDNPLLPANTTLNANQTLNVTHKLTINPTHHLTAQQTATLTLNELQLDPGSQLTLKDNATINIPTTNNATGSTTAFNWLTGTLNVTGPSGAALDNPLLPANTTLADDQTLNVTNTLIINPSQLLLVTGTGHFTANTLFLFGGAVAAPAINIGDQVGAIAGQGNVTANITGGSPTSGAIIATGLLTVGNPSSTDGFNFGGAIDADINTLFIQDADQATLGHNNTLATGGAIVAANGAILPPASTLAATGSATFSGNFQNNGTVNGPTSPGDFLTFSSDVTGPGHYTGNIRMNKIYSPGLSPAINNFTGNLTLTSSATLQLQAQAPSPPDAAPTPGAAGDHDQINITNNVTLHGTLSIDLLNPVTKPTLGTTYSALTYATRTPNSFFHTITGALIDTTFALAPLLDDTTGTLNLRATIPGDLNLDNKVSIADLSTFALNFNTIPGLYNELNMTNSWQLGDFNTDGQITVADLSLLALNFGFDATDPTSKPTPLSIHTLANITGLDPASIPEPTTFFLISPAAFLLIHRPTRNRNQTTQIYA